MASRMNAGSCSRAYITTGVGWCRLSTARLSRMSRSGDSRSIITTSGRCRSIWNNSPEAEASTATTRNPQRASAASTMAARCG
jgi:hypothetical protein